MTASFPRSQFLTASPICHLWADGHDRGGVDGWTEPDAVVEIAAFLRWGQLPQCPDLAPDGSAESDQQVLMVLPDESPA